MGFYLITGLLGSSAVGVLAWRRPWKAPGFRAMVLLIIYGYQAHHAGPRDRRPLMQRREDGPGAPPVGSMSAADERHYRQLAHLPPALPPAEPAGLADDYGWASGPGGPLPPERAPDHLWGSMDAGPAPVERTDGGGQPGGAWMNMDAPGWATGPLPWPETTEPPPLALGHTDAPPPLAAPLAALPEPPGAFLGPLPPGGDDVPEPVPIGPSFDPDGPGYELGQPEPEPEARGWELGGMRWAPLRLVGAAELFDARLAADVATDIDARKADADLYIIRMAAAWADTLRGLTERPAITEEPWPTPT